MVYMDDFNRYVVLFLLNKILNNVKEDANKKIITSLTLFFIIYCLIIVPLGIIKIGPYNETILYYTSFVGYGILGYFLAKTDFTKLSKKFKPSKKFIFIFSFASFVLLYIYFLVNITNLSVISNHFESITYFGILTVLYHQAYFYHSDILKKRMRMMNILFLRKLKMEN